MDPALKLPEVPLVSLRATLTRAVAIRSLFPRGAPANPDYLYTSGKQNRYNLNGTECLYASFEEATALAEYRQQFAGLSVGRDQPVGLFHINVALDGVLDLTLAEARKMLGVTILELEADWGGGLPPSRSQQIGDAAARHGGITAIRYHSVAAGANTPARSQSGDVQGGGPRPGFCRDHRRGGKSAGPLAGVVGKQYSVFSTGWSVTDH